MLPFFFILLFIFESPITRSFGCYDSTTVLMITFFQYMNEQNAYQEN